MTNALVPGFPNEPQEDYARISKASLPGASWEEEFWNARPLNGLLAHVDEVAFVKTLTFGNNTPTDAIGLKLNGGLVSVPSGADATATALAWSNALMLAGFAWKVLVDQSVPAAAVVTITGVLGQDPVLEVVAGGATTLVIGITTAAALQPIVCYGEGVVHSDAGDALNPNKFKRPSALTDKFMGVVLRTNGSQIPAGQLHEYDPNLDPANLVPGFSYSVERADIGITVEYAGTAPTVLDPVYHIMTGTDAGKWAITDGAVSQVTQGDVEFSTTDLVGWAVDSLPDLTVASDTSDDITVAALRDAWNASAQHAAVAVMTIDISGAESLSILSFIDDQLHTTVAVSPATADIVAITNTTAAVAANAALHAEYSWGLNAIEASSDLPARAFLRLSRS